MHRHELYGQPENSPAKNPTAKGPRAKITATGSFAIFYTLNLQLHGVGLSIEANLREAAVPCSYAPAVLQELDYRSTEPYKFNRNCTL